MIKFDINQFMIDNRLSPPHLAARMNVHVSSIHVMKFRGTVKLSFIRDLEKEFGDCTKYIINETVEA